MNIYQTNSLQPDYYNIMSGVALGELELLYERFLLHGEKEIIVTTARRNPEYHIKYSARKFKITLKEYRSWKCAWWREVLQNSIDSGATEIKLSCEKITSGEATGNYLVTCTDNGPGMDRDILFNKFLTIGESGKENVVGSVGGFGVAKELILFPWISWVVRTQNFVVQGAGLESNYQDDSPYFNGTSVSVIMPADNYAPAVYAKSVLSKSFLPDIMFLLKDHDENKFSPYAANLIGQKLVGSVSGDLARVYYAEGPENYNMTVRVVGPRGSLFMFDRFVGTLLPGYFLAEIDGSKSTDFLSSNRDGFSDQGQALEQLLAKIATEAAKDVSSFSRRFKNLFKRFYPGDPELVFQARQDRSQVMEALGSLDSLGSPESAAEEATSKIDEIVEDIRKRDEEEAAKKASEGESTDSYKSEVPSKEVAQTMLDVLMAKYTKGEISQDGLESVANQIVWKPPFAIINEIEGFIPPADFFPPTMSRKAVRLLKTWVELCRFVLTALNCSKPWSAGFMFSQKVLAAFYPYDSDDEEWQGTTKSNIEGFLMLNPFKKTKGYGKDAVGVIFEPRKNLDWLWAAAVHECTHMVDGISSHDEAFASALTTNIAKVMRFYSKAKKVSLTIKMDEGLSALEAAQATKAMKRVIEEQRRKELHRLAESGDIVPKHEFTPSRGRIPPDPLDRKCFSCGKRLRDHNRERNWRY